MAVCGLAVEFGEGEGPRVVEEGVEVVYAVEDGDDVEEGSREAHDVLREDGFGDVAPWTGNLFCHVGHTVGCAYSKCSIKHACNEDKAIAAPTRLVLPVLPHERTARVALASPAGHDGAYKNGDKHTTQNQAQADLGDGRKTPIKKHDDGGRDPCHDEVDDEDMPALEFITPMKQSVHGDDLIREDGGNGCGAEEPAEEVPPVQTKVSGSSRGCILKSRWEDENPPASIESNNTPILGTCSYAGPVVYSS